MVTINKPFNSNSGVMWPLRPLTFLLVGYSFFTLERFTKTPLDPYKKSTGVTFKHEENIPEGAWWEPVDYSAKHNVVTLLVGDENRTCQLLGLSVQSCLAWSFECLNAASRKQTVFYCRVFISLGRTLTVFVNESWLSLRRKCKEHDGHLKKPFYAPLFSVDQ